MKIERIVVEQIVEQIVGRAQAGDRDAFAALVERYQRVTITRAWMICGDFHLAQDIAQDAFVLAFQKLESLDNPAAFGPWLLEIARREAVRKSKRIRKQDSTIVSSQFAIEDCSVNNPTDDAHWQRRHEQTLNTIAKLPEHEQEVVVLHYLDGNSTKEIAEMLDRPLGTVTKQLSRAIERLRNWLTEVSNEVK